MTTATTLRKYQDIIEGKLPPGLQAHIDAKSESKEEEVEESTEEEVEESRHFSLSQVNNAPMLRKYQDILKEVGYSATSTDASARALQQGLRQEEERKKKEAEEAEFDRIYDEYYKNFDDPHQGWYDNLGKTDDQVRLAKRERYYKDTRKSGLDDLSGAGSTKHKELERARIIKQEIARQAEEEATMNRGDAQLSTPSSTIASTNLELPTKAPAAPASSSSNVVAGTDAAPAGITPTPSNAPKGFRPGSGEGPGDDKNPPSSRFGQTPAQTAPEPALSASDKRLVQKFKGSTQAPQSRVVPKAPSVPTVPKEFNPHDGVVGFPLNSDSRYSYTKPEPKVVTSPELKPKQLPQKHRETRPRMLGQ